MPVHFIDISENAYGWDIRRLLEPYVAGVTHVVIREPYLTQEFQREGLRRCLDFLGSAGVRLVEIHTCFKRDASEDQQLQTRAELALLRAPFARIGVEVRASIDADFHRRTINLWSGPGRYTELWLDIGLHFWKPPRSRREASALSLRRTLSRRIAVSS